MTIFQILNKRYKYESLISYRKTFDLPSYNSDINSLYFFLNNGHKNNRFRKNYKEAKELAIEIIDYYDKYLGSLDKQLER